MEVGDVVLVSGPWDSDEADDSIRKFEGQLGVVEDASVYIYVICPFHPDHQRNLEMNWATYGTPFLIEELTLMRAVEA